MQVLEPGLSRMVLPVLSRILTLSGIARPDLSKGVVYIPWIAQICRAALLKGCQSRDILVSDIKHGAGAEEWNPMVQSIVVGCAGLVQYLADAYPPTLPDWDRLGEPL